MTLYVYEITVDPSSEKKDTIQIDDKIIFAIFVRFPPGPSALLELQIFYGEEQIFPRPKGAVVKGDDEIIYDFIFWEAPEKPVKLRVYAKNNDIQYPHTAIIRILTLPEWLFYALKMMGRAYQILARIASLIWGRV